MTPTIEVMAKIKMRRRKLLLFINDRDIIDNSRLIERRTFSLFVLTWHTIADKN